MHSLIEKANVLVQALPYIQRFKNSIVVIKFGGSTMEDEEVINRTMRDIVLLHAIGIKPVVVHGGGKAINAKLKELNIESKFINGLRYTCERTIEVVDRILHSKVNADLVKKTISHGGNPIGISGKKVLCAEKLYERDQTTLEEIEYGFVGDVIFVNPAPILFAINDGFIPIVTPLAQDKNGQVFNINADIAACKIAQSLQATKLVFLSDVPGILQDATDKKTLIPTIFVREVEGYIQSKVITGGMIPKINSAVTAIRAGVQKVHMIGATMSHALLLEIFTDSGVGTEILRDPNYNPKTHV